jgi:hypothetical protein
MTICMCPGRAFALERNTEIVHRKSARHFCKYRQLA